MTLSSSFFFVRWIGLTSTRVLDLNGMIALGQ